MRKWLLAAAALLGLTSSAFAVCPSPLTGKDAANTTQNFGVTVDGGGNCYGNVALVDGTAAANKAAVNASGQLAVAGPVTNAGTFAVQLSGATNNINNISGTVSLPTGAATSALQTTGNTTLTTINTTLGSPFQAGGSIGNTSFAATQATASLLNATVVGTGTFAVQLSGATNNINNIAGTITLPTGAATSANQTNASQKTQIVDGSGNVIASTSNNLNVQCANCSGSGASAADAATFTAGTSVFAPAGGQFTSGGATACVTAHQCMVGMTAARGFFTDTSTVNGVAVLTGTGAVGTGAQRIAVGTDTATIAGSAPGTAGSASTNVVSVQGIASMTPLLVNPGTAANWGVVTQGSTTSGQSGNMVQGAVTTSAPTYTTAQTSPLSLDTAGNLRVVGTGIAQGSTTSGQTGSLVLGAVTTSAPTYTTAQSSPLSLDTAGNLRVNVVAGGGSGGTSIADAATFTAGTTVFTPMGGQFTSGGATACVTGHACWVGMTAARAIFTDVSSVNGVTVLTGTGATGTGAQRVTVSTDQATNAGAALVKGGVGVVNGGSTYQHIAASQTATVLQTSTGAAGDYLSHCVIYPTTTAAGSVTVFDNANAAATNVIEFATGTLSNLAPIPIPVGAVSTAGAWKVTTGANETVVCYGKFS